MNQSNDTYIQDFINGNVIDTIQDIELLSDLCVVASRDLILENLITVLPIQTMMKYGLFPVPYDDMKKYFIDMLTMDENTLSFWHRHTIEPPLSITSLDNITKWYYYTLETHCRNGIMKALSFPLLYVAPDLVYNKSKRPKTEMHMFRSPSSIRVPRDNIVNGKISISGEIWDVIPVTRYAEGMSKGCYYTEECDTPFCSTFYYYEPESTTFLAYKTSKIYFNKTDALMKLGEEHNKNYFSAWRNGPSSIIMAHIKGVLPPDLMMTPSEFTTALPILSDITEANMLPQIKAYGGYDILYNSEDKYDQILCLAGKEYNIDVIILTHMVGMFQVVKEVLDTRSRVESFRSLIYTY